MDYKKYNEDLMRQEKRNQSILIIGAIILALLIFFVCIYASHKEAEITLQLEQCISELQEE